MKARKICFVSLNRKEIYWRMLEKFTEILNFLKSRFKGKLSGNMS